LAELVDIAAERVRLQEALEEAEGEIARAGGKLANVNFVTKAPPEVVDKERQRQALAQEEARRLRIRLEELG
jgi:valyl-tRNA synthetase